MAKALVMIYTTLRKRLGISRAEFEGENIGELIEKLCALKEPEVRKLILDGDGRVKNYFVLTLNSEILDNGKAAGVKVKDGDILHVFPPVSGG
ncbi:MAG: MoaD/ThiS family protein [Elusimicrobia bacterium]|nr:MoaD/ThiS family protein [Elusimicrobiota bacterium]